MPFLLKNGPNSNKVGKGHILPLNTLYNEVDLRRTAPYLGGTESELLSLHKIACRFNSSQRPVLERTDIRKMSSLYQFN